MGEAKLFSFSKVTVNVCTCYITILRYNVNVCEVIVHVCKVPESLIPNSGFAFTPWILQTFEQFSNPGIEYLELGVTHMR